jgi:exoribonuclease-2
MDRSPSSNRHQLKDIARRAMLERGLLPEFSAAALAEAAALTKAAADPGPSHVDLRDRLWASIDNDDSRDLDQLSVAEEMPGGTVKVLVAIADVDASVKRGSAIDAHARTNTTSVYTAGAIFPMLPERLSTDLTSLGENEDRLAVVIEMVVLSSGMVTESQVYQATVRNRAKLAYRTVAAWLDGQGPMPHPVAAVQGMDDQLRVQDRVARALKGLRRRQGALTLASLESRAVFEGDAISDLKPEEKNRAKELIEDFMIAANGVTAKFLERKGFASLRRVLRSPERWGRIVALAEGFGEPLPSEPDAAALAQFLAKCEAKDPARFPDLSLSIIKLLGRGEYVLETPGEHTAGHFGLAVRDYTHSTAPNRRFPDLITQRLLKAALSGSAAPYDRQELFALANHCTEQEDNAAKVERRIQKSAAALLLQKRVGERFDGLVTGASDTGTWVRTFSPPVEGRVVRGFRGLDVGDRVRVELVSTDVERGYIDFAVVGA